MGADVVGGASADPAPGPAGGAIARWWARWSASSAREVESKLWLWRFGIGAAGLALWLVLPHSPASGLAFPLVVGPYLVGYVLLRRSKLGSSWFGLALFSMDLAAITAAALFTGGVQSPFVYVYLFPVAVVGITRGTWEAVVLATVALGLHVATLGVEATLLGSPHDTVALVMTLYGVSVVVGTARGEIGRAQVALSRQLATLHEGAAGFAGASSIAALLQQSVAMAAELVGTAYAAVSIWDEKGEIVHFHTAGMGSAEKAHLGSPPTGPGLLGMVRDAPGPVRLADARRHPAASDLPPGHPEVRTFLGVPVHQLGGWTGACYMIGKRPWPQTFGTRALSYLEAIAVPVAELLAISKLHAEVERAALTDVLTQVGNRRYGLQRLEEACAHAARTGQACAVLMLDLDGFKGVNDRFGHEAGDEVLREVVRRLRQELRVEDVLARYGGDEFLVIVTDTVPLEATRLARRLPVSSGRDDIAVQGQSVRLPKWSVGLAVWPDDGRDPDELLRSADARLYLYKTRAGAGRARERAAQRAGAPPRG
ncbi:MAG: sensor domain-containing diguanylate cyclase [Acidimicrobiales bacterium]